MNKAKLMKAIFHNWDGQYLPSDEALKQVLESLEPRERFVIAHYFGDTPMTFRDIGEICPRGLGGFGLTRERVRQIEAKALRKLRHPTRIDILWPDRCIHPTMRVARILLENGWGR